MTRKPWHWAAVRAALDPRHDARRYMVERTGWSGGRYEYFWRRTAALHRFADAVARREAPFITLTDEFTGERILRWEDPSRAIPLVDPDGRFAGWAASGSIPRRVS